MAVPGWQLRDFQEKVEMVRNGDKKWEKFCRELVASCAETCPLSVLIELCEALIRGRQRDYESEISRN